METVKQFFKPTRLKLLLFATLIIISALFGFEKVDDNCHRGWYGCHNYYQPRMVIFPVDENIYLNWEGDGKVGELDRSEKEKLVKMYINGLIYWYFLSCLIAFPFRKEKFH